MNFKERAEELEKEFRKQMMKEIDEIGHPQSSARKTHDIRTNMINARIIQLKEDEEMVRRVIDKSIFIANTVQGKFVTLDKDKFEKELGLEK